MQQEKHEYLKKNIFFFNCVSNQTVIKLERIQKLYFQRELRIVLKTQLQWQFEIALAVKCAHIVFDAFGLRFTVLIDLRHQIRLSHPADDNYCWCLCVVPSKMLFFSSHCVVLNYFFFKPSLCKFTLLYKCFHSTQSHCVYYGG